MKRTLTTILVLGILITPLLAKDYILAPNDKLEVRILGQSALDTTQTIAPDGSVSLPITGRTQAAGQTLKDFQAQIKHDFSAFIPKANVVVHLTPRPYYVIEQNGDNRKITEAKTLDEATALAGTADNNSNIILAETQKPIFVVIHNLKTNIFETKTAQTIPEARALAGNYTGEIPTNNIIEVYTGRAPDFWEDNWYKVLSGLAVATGIYNSLK